MKILMEALGFGGSDNLGGSVRVAAINATAVAAQGHKVVFLCTNRRDRKSKLYPGYFHEVVNGVEVHYLDTHTVPGWPGSFGPHYVTVPSNVRAMIAEVDVVHLHEFRSYLAGFVARTAAAHHVPIVVQPQGTLPRHRSRSMIKMFYDLLVGRQLLTKASCFVAVTSVESKVMARAGVSPDRIEVVGNGMVIDPNAALPERGAFRAKMGISEKAPLIVSVGRVHPMKGFDLMIRALPNIPDSTQYVVVGPHDGAAESLQTLAKELGIEDRFRMTGPLPDARDVQAAVVDSDVFVVPSRSEAFGQVILEACLASRPLVLSSGCDAAPHFEGKCALVVSPEPDELAKACSRLLGDPELRARFGRAGRQLLDSDYGAKAIAAKLEAVYRGCLATNRTKEMPSSGLSAVSGIK